MRKNTEGRKVTAKMNSGVQCIWIVGLSERMTAWSWPRMLQKCSIQLRIYTLLCSKITISIRIIL
jgi:hypothetical protein